MKKSRSGFTLIELLVVIVVIAILASIVAIAYNGAQARTRDTRRLTDAKNIIKALRLYQSDDSNGGSYPTTTATPIGSCTGLGVGYSYSFATDGSWLPALVSSNSIDAVPTPPNSGCSSYYQYLYVATPTSYNCPSRTTPYFVLIVKSEGSMTPPDSKTFTPCVGSTVTWTASKTNWVFASDNLRS